MEDENYFVFPGFGKGAEDTLAGFILFNIFYPPRGLNVSSMKYLNDLKIFQSLFGF